MIFYNKYQNNINKELIILKIIKYIVIQIQPNLNNKILFYLNN